MRVCVGAGTAGRAMSGDQLICSHSHFALVHEFLCVCVLPISHQFLVPPFCVPVSASGPLMFDSVLEHSEQPGTHSSLSSLTPTLLLIA